MLIFIAIIWALGYFLSYYFDSPEILIFAFIFSVFQVALSYWYSDKIVLSMSGAKRVTRDSHRDLWNITENLSITAGLPMPKLYVINDSVPNAFATGRNKKHSAVAVTTGLIQILDRNEMEGVIAHELSHIGNRDILISSVIVVLVGFITLLSDFFVRSTLWGGKRSDNRSGGGQIQIIIMVAGVVLMILSPIIATLIQLSVSRKREYLADASGALLTRYPEGLASALEKISKYSGKMKRANHATAHLFISSPFGDNKKKKGWWQKIWSTHPPAEERIKRLRG